MTYALIEKGEVKAYPYSFTDLRRDNPDVSYPRDPTDEILAEHGLVAVAASERPATDETKNVVEASPVLVNGVWTRAWSVVDADSALIAQRRKEASDSATTSGVKADTFVRSFVEMTPAQVDAYVRAQVGDAKTAAVISKLAQMLLVLVRRELRD